MCAYESGFTGGKAVCTYKIHIIRIYACKYEFRVQVKYVSTLSARKCVLNIIMRKFKRENVYISMPHMVEGKT